MRRFADEALGVVDSAVLALAAEHADLDLDHIEPASLVKIRSESYFLALHASSTILSPRSAMLTGPKMVSGTRQRPPVRIPVGPL